MKKILLSLPARLLFALCLGMGIGAAANAAVMQVVVTLQQLLSAVIMFTVPLIIIGFIAPSITKLGSNASRMLGVALLLAYASSVGAAFFAAASGYAILPHLHIVSDVGGQRPLPQVIFDLKIPPIMSVMSALVFSVMVGVAATWRHAKSVIAALDEFQGIVLLIVNRIIIPLLPFFIACTFSTLAYEGVIAKQLPVFLTVIVLVIAGHVVWLTLLYTLAGLYAKKNPL
ncbi:MAG: cation:dicarboxylase symporter family transporter, partial [Prevotellaceae bacterium]|nr:cation:dicarboxylase symporter family transporter [Prevotellaceae bacterium]